MSLDADRSSPLAGEPSHGTALDASPRHKLTIVGVGASAGGLAALEELLAAAPFDSIAFVVVQHMSPRHESLLPQLLARASRYTVLTATHGTTVAANHVYVIPPDTQLGIKDRALQVLGGIHDAAPIDFFLRALAEDQGDAAMGIILSGTGSDGTEGLKAIRAAGGLTFIQEPSTAQYDGMPKSALAGGGADYCLAPAAIARELASHTSRRRAPLDDGESASVAGLFSLIRSEFRNDLAAYKPATIERRVQRRMAIRGVDSAADYLKLVKDDHEELAALYRDMLIRVTRFFRDDEPIEALQRKVLAPLVAERREGLPIRIWVPGCATGEEAYSIAIALAEILDSQGLDLPVQIFATDVDADAIAHARRGTYSAAIKADVSPERLNRYFTKVDGGYQIARRIRDLLVFSTQNVLRDAPFSRVDVISCRNLLIYLRRAAQRTALELFHHALLTGGHLLLGASETVGDAPSLFAIVDSKNKIYVKKRGGGALPTVRFESTHDAVTTAAARPAAKPPLPLEVLADRAVLAHYGPAGVVVDQHMQIVQFRGHTGAFLDPSPGAPSLDLMRLARPELRMELGRLVQQALSEGKPAFGNATIQSATTEQAVKLTALPLGGEGDGPPHVVLLNFEPEPAHQPVILPEPTAADEQVRPFAERIQTLERELALTRRHLQSTLEEKESANEELKSANEELQSSNEELQSTNEELQTSKEEMQSANEELMTVNDELHRRMAELSQANDDLHNVLAGVDNAVVVVGMDLRIRRFTTAAERLLNLVPGDTGRTIDYVRRFVGDVNVAAKVATVIETLAVFEQDVLCENGRYYSLRIVPYKTLSHEIRGAVITLVDVDVSKRASDLAEDVDAYAAKFLSATDHPVVIVDDKFRVIWANDALRDTFQLAPEEMAGSLLRTIGPIDWDDAALARKLEEALGSGHAFNDFPLRCLPRGQNVPTLRLSARRLDGLGRDFLLLISIKGDIDSSATEGPTP